MVTEAIAPESHPNDWTIVGVVAFALFLDYLLYGMLVPLTSLSPAGVHTEEHFGILYGGYAVSVLVVTPVFGYFGDRLGGRRTMFCGVVFGLLAAALSGHASSFEWLLAARLFEGAASAATWTAGLAVVAEHYPHQRVEMLGYAFIGSTFGSVLGPLLGGVMYKVGGYKLPFLGGSLLFVIEAGLLLLLPKGGRSQNERVDFRALLLDRSIIQAALAVGLAAFAWGILEPLLPLRLQRYGASAEAIGLMFTISSIVYGLGGRLVGKLSERLAARQLVVIGTLAMAATLPLLSASVEIILVGAAFCLVNVSYAFMLNPASAELAEAIDRSGKSNYTAVYAIYNVAYSIGMIVTTAIASQAAGVLGFGGTLLAVSAVLILFSLLAGLGKSAQSAVSEASLS
jgi:MFS transporter, DHA1 family, solute carrier family 18 (vesicular amine transporter), member 1/2